MLQSYQQPVIARHYTYNYDNKEEDFPPSLPTLTTLLHYYTTTYNTLHGNKSKKGELGDFIFEDRSQHASILQSFLKYKMGSFGFRTMIA